MRRFLLCLCSVLALSGSTAVAKKKPRPQLCADARYVVTTGATLIANGAPTVLALAGGQLSVEGACAPAKVGVKASKRGMQVSGKWKTCGDVRKIVLAARAATDCNSISGTIKAKKHKKATFAASLSRCGDAVVDAGRGEQCDGAACTSGAACTDQCGCNQIATVLGKVRNAAGPLAGVTVTDVSGAPSGTTDANGRVSLSLTTGVPHTLKLSRSGHADRFVVLTPPVEQTIGYFEAGMAARGITQSLAATGGTITGTQGTSLVVPAGALVDGAGNAVTGTVDVTLTPIDITTLDLAAFPGRFAGVRTGGSLANIASHGLVEITVSQNGQPLQLGSGKTATLEIPLFAALNLDGSDVVIGEHIPLWALDEVTGIWMQNGEGVVVASSGPSGLALQAEIPHLSWWNADIFFEDPYRPKPRCYRYNGTDYVPEPCALGPLPYGSHYDNTLQPFAAGRARGGITPALPPLKYTPAFAVLATIPAAGGVETPVPAGVDTILHACSLDGTQCGDITVNGASNVSEDVRIDLAPIDQGGGTITVPWKQDYAIDPADQVDTYSFTAQAGVAYGVCASRSQGSVLEGELAVSVGGTPAGSLPFGFGGAGMLFDPVAGGTIDITASGLRNAPGGYTLRVDQLTVTTPETLAVGETPTFNVLKNTANLRRYQLSGTANAPHIATLQATYSGIEIAGEARVTATDGTVLGRSHLMKAADTRVIFTMPANGQANLDIFSRSLRDDASGVQTYSAYLTQDQILSDEAVSVLPLKQTFAITTADALRRYRFTGTKGSLLRTRISPTALGFFTLSRAGQVIAGARLANDSFPTDQMTTLLDADGEYTLDVVCEGGCNATTRTLTLKTPQTVAVNGSVHGTIIVPQDVESVVFDLDTAGNYSVGLFNDNTAITGTDAQLFDPAGFNLNVAISDLGIVTFGLQDRGRHTIDVKNTGGATGGFMIGVASVQDPTAVAFSGNTASQAGQITSPGQVLYYTVDLAAGDHPQLSIDTPRANAGVQYSGLRARARLLGSNNPPFGGAALASAVTGADAGTETHADAAMATANQTGTYVVEISTATQGSGALTGAFTWSVTK